MWLSRKVPYNYESTIDNWQIDSYERKSLSGPSSGLSGLSFFKSGPPHFSLLLKQTFIPLTGIFLSDPLVIWHVGIMMMGLGLSRGARGSYPNPKTRNTYWGQEEYFLSFLVTDLDFVLFGNGNSQDKLRDKWSLFVCFSKK